VESENKTTDPSLEGRTAKCAYHGQRTSARGSYGGGNECNYGQRDHKVCSCVQPSSKELPFFEYCGPGSRECDEICKRCKYHKVAHVSGQRSRAVCSNFEPQGDRGFDKFYCGCAGWD
jgi:hypothetical protein